MNANVVVSFPIERIIRTPIPESVQENVKKTQKDYVNRLVDENATILVARLAMAGIDISTEDFQKSYALAIECLRSTVYMTLGIGHPLQEPIVEMIKAIEDCSINKD